jgi:polyferredoxin
MLRMHRHRLTKVKKHARPVVQSLWAVGTNAWIPGFIQGTVFTGASKNICLPGLNCYACPGALGACPIGALQAVIGSIGSTASFYMLGFFLIVGGVLGRVVCGFLCPFGFVQELLHRIPFIRKISTFRGDRQLRLLKYAILILFVILLPMLAVNAAGGGAPWFCKWICPAGTLEGGVPLPIAEPALRSAIGFLYAWKMALLAAVCFLSVVIYRPFCKYLCPLGAIYAVFNRISALRYTLREDQCTACGRCKSACPMQIDPRTETNAAECVHCGRCKSACPEDAISGRL